MTYRVYLRSPDQQVSDKTVTSDKTAALAAFGTLVDRTELDGSKLLAVLNCNGKPVAHHVFDASDPAKNWRGHLDEIQWP